MAIDDETQLTAPAGTTLSFDDHPAALVPTPEEAAPQPALPSAVSTPIDHPAANIPTPLEKPTSESSGGSYRGITQQGLKVTGRLNDEASRRAEGDLQRFAPQFDQLGGQAEDVAREKRAALAQETEAHKQHLEREGALWQAQQHIYSEQADLEKHAYAQSQVVKQQYLASYEQDLAAVRVLASQSGDPTDRMGAGAAIGLISQAAAQGFLKVGGINIDAMGFTERWINREIEKHQQQIQGARQVANDQLHLYDLARQSSQDDWEARERYRGMVLEGLKSQVGAEASRFGSQLAMATASQKGAEIDAQLLGVKSQLAERQQGLYFEAQKMRITEASDRAKNSVAWYSAQTARKEYDLKKKQDDEKKLAAVVKIPDPGATIRDSGGKVTGVMNGWALRDGAPDAVKSKIGDKGVEYASVIAATDKMRSLRPPAMNDFVEKYGTAGAANRFSEARRTYEREKKLAMMDARHAIAGASLTDNEKKEWDTILENDSGWEDGTNASAVDQFEKHYRDRFVSEMNQSPWVRPLDDSERDVRPTYNGSNDTDASYNTAVHPNPAITTSVQEAAKDVTRVGRNEVGGKGYSAAFSQYMDATGDQRGADGQVMGQRHEIDAIDSLAALVAKPEMGLQTTVEGKPSGDPQAVRQEAYKVLSDIAQGKATGNGRPPDPTAQQYASFLLKKMDESQDPEAFFGEVSTKTAPEGPRDGESRLDYTDRLDEEKRGNLLRKGITGQE